MTEPLRENKAKGVRLVVNGSTYIVETYVPGTGTLLSVRNFVSAPRSANRYYNRALNAAAGARHIDNSSLSKIARGKHNGR